MSLPASSKFPLMLLRYSSRSVLNWGLILGVPCIVGCNEQVGQVVVETVDPSTNRQGSVVKTPDQVFVVEHQIWPQSIQVQGSLLGDEQAVVGTKIPGKVEAVVVDLGDVVKQGTPLVMLETHELQLRVDQAQAQLAQACAAIGMRIEDSEDDLDSNAIPSVRLERALLEEAQLNLVRGQELIARNAISPQETDRLATSVRTAEARYAAALDSVQEKIALVRLSRAELSLARQALADAQINAPFDGIVRQRSTAPGEFLQTGQPVVTLVRVETLRFTAGVPERYAGLIQRGQDLSIQVTGHRQPVRATITRISPTLDLASRSLIIEADVENKGFDLRGGLFGQAEIVINPQAETLVVPVAAVTEFAGVEKVMRLQDGQPVQQIIRTGRTQNGFVEILEGLQTGDTVTIHDTTSSNVSERPSPTEPQST